MKVTLFIYTEEYTRHDHFTVPDDADREQIMNEARRRLRHHSLKTPTWVDVYAGDVRIGTIQGVTL